MPGWPPGWLRISGWRRCGTRLRALAAGVQGTLLTPEQATAHHPLLDPAALAGAWLNPDSGRLNPADLVAAYARAARKRGARIVEDCTVEQVYEMGDHYFVLGRVMALEADADHDGEGPFPLLFFKGTLGGFESEG